MDHLIAACSALGWYGPQMRALLISAYSGMRPGELFALEWRDIDFDTMRIHVGRRVYIDRAFKATITPLRTVDSDAIGMHGGPQSAS